MFRIKCPHRSHPVIDKSDLVVAALREQPFYRKAKRTLVVDDLATKAISAAAREDGKEVFLQPASKYMIITPDGRELRSGWVGPEQGRVDLVLSSCWFFMSYGEAYTKYPQIAEMNEYLRKIGFVDRMTFTVVVANSYQETMGRWSRRDRKLFDLHYIVTEKGIRYKSSTMPLETVDGDKAAVPGTTSNI